MPLQLTALSNWLLRFATQCRNWSTDYAFLSHWLPGLLLIAMTSPAVG